MHVCALRSSVCHRNTHLIVPVHLPAQQLKALRSVSLILSCLVCVCWCLSPSYFLFFLRLSSIPLLSLCLLLIKVDCNLTAISCFTSFDGKSPELSLRCSRAVFGGFCFFKNLQIRNFICTKCSKLSA